MKVVWNLKWRKALSAFIIGICLIILPKVPLSAAAAEGTEGPDLTRTGTLTIEFRDSQTGRPFSFENKVGIFKAADISLENGLQFVYDELFESVGDPPTLASEMNDELADRLWEVAEFKGISLDAPSVEISESGIATFKDLDPGLYLIVQTYRGTDSLRYQIRPFIVTMPVQKSDGSFAYNVNMLYLAGDEGPGSAELAMQGASMVDSTSVEGGQKEKKSLPLVPVICVLIAAAAVVVVIRRRR